MLLITQEEWNKKYHANYYTSTTYQTYLKDVNEYPTRITYSTMDEYNKCSNEIFMIKVHKNILYFITYGKEKYQNDSILFYNAFRIHKQYLLSFLSEFIMYLIKK